MNITSERRLTIVVNQIIHEWINNVLNQLQNKVSISIDISNTFTSTEKRQSSSSRSKSSEFISSSKTNNRKYRRDMSRHSSQQSLLSHECSREASITRWCWEITKRRENRKTFSNDEHAYLMRRALFYFQALIFSECIRIKLNVWAEHKSDAINDFILKVWKKCKRMFERNIERHSKIMNVSQNFETRIVKSFTSNTCKNTNVNINVRFNRRVSN